MASASVFVYWLLSLRMIRNIFGYAAIGTQVSTLSDQVLWDYGWGYRAPRIVKLCSELNAMEGGGEKWLTELRATSSRLDACNMLRKLTGNLNARSRLLSRLCRQFSDLWEHMHPAEQRGSSPR